MPSLDTRTSSESIINDSIKQVNRAIAQWVPIAGLRPQIVYEAMRYSLDAGGKRIRPLLLLGAHKLYPSSLDPMPAAVALECIHTFSLIHDDLPEVDNSDLRRGKPTCHKAFGQDMALLAGDALFNHSFKILTQAYAGSPEVLSQLMCTLTCRFEDVLRGQVEDILNSDKAVNENSEEVLNFIHRHKTAALIEASLVMGLYLNGADEDIVSRMCAIGQDVGLAFQIIDDILDVTSDASTLGKTPGLDLENKTLTYPSLYGIDASRKQAQELTESAISALQTLGGDPDFLLSLFRMLEARVS